MKNKLPPHITADAMEQMAMNAWHLQRCFNLSTGAGSFDTAFYKIAVANDPNPLWHELPYQEQAIFMGGVISMMAVITKVPLQDIADLLYKGIPIQAVAVGGWPDEK